MVTFIILEEVMKKKHPAKRKCAFRELFITTGRGREAFFDL